MIMVVKRLLKRIECNNKIKKNYKVKITLTLYIVKDDIISL